MFGAGTPAMDLSRLTPWFLVMLVAAVLGACPLAETVKRKKGWEPVSFVLAFLLLAWCMLRLAGGSYNPFIYFSF